MEDRFEDFVARDYPRLIGALGLICGSREVAEDAVAEAMMRAWQRLDRGEQIDSLAAWIRVVALNQARTWGRRRRAEVKARERPAASSVESTAAVETGDVIDVGRALYGLPRRQREVTVLRFYLDMDVRSIAGALGISAGSVKTSLSRARETLAHSLGEPAVAQVPPETIE